MQQVKDIFEPLIGKIVWSVRRGHGSFLTMEFGMPHLSIRQPIVSESNISDRVKRNLERRRVFIVGDWHLWIKYAEWTVNSGGNSVRSESDRKESDVCCFEEIDGQTLTSYSINNENTLILRFDLGGELSARHSALISDDQWSLFLWDGDIFTLQGDGTLVFEKASHRAS